MTNRTILEEAAYNYASQKYQAESAEDSGVPQKFCDDLWVQVGKAKEVLRLAAIDYYDSVYDGAPLY